MSEIPYTTGQFDPTQTSISPEAQRIYDVASGYKDIVEFAYGDDIAETVDGELDALQAVTTIGYLVENDPAYQLSREQHGMLASVEAHAAALGTATSLSEQQNTTLADLNQSQQTSILVNQLGRERYDQYRAATDPEEQTRLRHEMLELKEYSNIIDDNDGIADVSSIENAVKLYNSGAEDPDLSDKVFAETKANAFFAKYAQEIIAKATPAKERGTVMTDDEVAAAREQIQKLNHSTGNRPAPTPEQKQAVEGARRSVEQARSVELFNNVVKLGKNHTQLHTDVLTDGRIGFKNVGDSPRHDFEQFVIPKDLEKRFNSTDWRQELNEVVMFSDVVERETRQVVIPQETRGRFGRTHKSEHTKTEVVLGSEHPKMIRNELTGQDEPTVRFRYQFRYGMSAHNQGRGVLPPYQEFSGYRNGQQVLAGLDLPKSIADQLQKQVDDNPQSVRTLVQQLFLENSNGKITNEYWTQGGELKHPIRPPYEQLPKDWTMAVVTGTEGGRASDYSVQRVATQ